MKKILILILIILSASPIFAQLCNPGEFIRTNPDNYSNREDPTEAKKWDWRTQTYDTYLKITGSNSGQYLQISTPWFALIPNTFQPNVDYLRAQLKKDFEPEDGWELLFKFFGTSTSDYVEFPTFALYNRFESKIRIFVYVESNRVPTYNGAYISMMFANTSYQSFLLNPVEPYQNALDGKLIKEIPNVVNKYDNLLNDGGIWLQGDILVAYDPCTCKNTFSDYLEVNSHLTVSSNVDLNGWLTINSKSVLSPAGVAVSPFISIVKDIQGNAQKVSHLKMVL